MKDVLAFLQYLFIRFERNENRKNASALTFVTLFALVPLMTVGYSVLKVFPQFSSVSDEFYNFLFQHFVPTSGTAIREYLERFSEQASKLTWIGSLFLLVSAVGLMLTVENSINRIWKVKKARSGKMRFLIYWAMLSLGPIFLGIAVLVSSYLFSLPLISDVDTYLGHSLAIVGALPFLFSTLALTLMYKVVPGCYVDVKWALIGAISAAILLEIGKKLFAELVKSFPSYEFIYGAFSIVPLFLVWIYIAWCVVLLGAELVRALSFANKKKKGISGSDLDWALELLRLIYLGQQQNEMINRAMLAKNLPMVNADDWEHMLSLLLDSGWIIQARNENYVIGVDLHIKSVSDLSELIHQKLLGAMGVQWEKRKWHALLGARFNELLEKKQAILGLPVYNVLFDAEETVQNIP